MNTHLKWALALLLISMLSIAACAPSAPASNENTTGETAPSEETNAVSDENVTGETDPSEAANAASDEHAGDADADHNDADADHNDGDDHGHLEAPAEYANLSNPFAGDAKAAEVGKAVFQNGCASCHGPEGKGDGPAAASLNPKPSNFTDSAMMGELSDAYLFWRISEGGAMEPFNSVMPAWKDVFSADERWQIVTYLRTLHQ